MSELRVRAAVSPLRRRVATFPTRLPSVDAVIAAERPEEPMHCLRPATVAATARAFIEAFPGDVLYAVKCNPDPAMLHAVAAGGKQVAACRQAAVVEKRATKLPIGAEQQDSHALKTGKRSGATSCRNGVIRSLSDNSGSLTGQSMPSAPSFQRMPASVLASYSAVHW